MNLNVAESLLNLPENYTLLDVKKKWKHKMKKCHPDFGNNPKKAVDLNIAKCIVLDAIQNEQPILECDCKKTQNFCQPFDDMKQEEDFWNCVIEGTLDEYFSDK